jgi:two-component system nitrate/nitrite response regulator NarL
VGLRCLLVDDNDEFLDSASRLLSAQGLEVVGRATSGAAAVRLVQTFEPDVALVDVRLRNEDSLELTRRLTAAAPGTRIILISTHAENEVTELILDSPAVGFLPKTALGAAAIAEVLR